MKKFFVATLSLAVGAAIGAFCAGKVMATDVAAETERGNKFKKYYQMLDQWLILKHEGVSLKEYFINNGYSKIAIYGMGHVGNRLYDEMKGTGIEVLYAIDENADFTYSDIEVLGKDDDYPEVDAIVVTVASAFDTIKAELCQKVNCPIISLEDVVFGI